MVDVKTAKISVAAIVGGAIKHGSLPFLLGFNVTKQRVIF